MVPIFLLGFVFHMPESLKYSLVKQDIMRFENDMDYICEMNKATEAERQVINELVERYCEQVHEDNKHKKAHTIQSATKKQGKIVQLICRDKESFYNLGLMILCWISNTFTYFLVIFLVKYLPGSLYMNQLVSGFSVIGYLVVPMLAPRFDNRRIMLFGYGLSIVFLVAMLFVEQGGIWSSTDDLIYSLIFFLFKCGVSMVFISLFVIHQDLFTTKYLATSYGLCNTVSRVLTLGEPLIAEIPNRAVPVALMLGLNCIAIVATYYLRMKKPHQ